MTTTNMPAHPDTIPGLAADCRRVLRADYQRIQVAMSAGAEPGPSANAPIHDAATDRYLTGDAARKARAAAQSQHESSDKASRSHAVAAAIAEYRRTAELWGVDVG